MNILPKELSKDGEIKAEKQTAFLGLCRDDMAGGKDISNMKNISSRFYPGLATREERRLISTDKLTETPYTVSANENTYIVRGKYIYRLMENGDESHDCRCTEGDKTIIGAGSSLFVLPDKIYFSGERHYFYNIGVASCEESVAEIGENTIKISGKDFFALGFSFEYGINIKLKEYVPFETLSGGYRIKYMSKDTITIDGTFTMTGTYKIEIKHAVPDFDYGIGIGNRILGCKGNKIYACEEGNPFNWVGCRGMDSDPFTVQSESEGAFTGCAVWQGYAIFFKENYMCKLLGNKPSNYVLSEIMAPGVAKGTEKLLCSLGGALFYRSTVGFCRYNGAYPEYISNNLSQRMLPENFKPLFAGSDGVRYYVHGTNSDGEFIMYTYDPEVKLWYAEDGFDTISMSGKNGSLYLLTRNGDLWKIGGGDEGRKEHLIKGAIPSFVEFGYDDGNSSNAKKLLRLHLQIDMAEGATVKLYVKYYASEDWMAVGEHVGEGRMEYLDFDLFPRRTRAFKIKLEMNGECKIYSLTREYRISEGRV